MLDSIKVHFADGSKWVAGEVLEFLGGKNENDVIAVISAEDGRIVATKLDNVRHGAKTPDSLPALYAAHAGGVRRHTLKLHNGKHMIASPDGIVKAEYDDEETAQAHLLTLEPDLAPKATVTLPTTPILTGPVVQPPPVGKTG